MSSCLISAITPFASGRRARLERRAAAKNAETTLPQRYLDEVLKGLPVGGFFAVAEKPLPAKHDPVNSVHRQEIELSNALVGLLKASARYQCFTQKPDGLKVYYVPLCYPDRKINGRLPSEMSPAAFVSIALVTKSDNAKPKRFYPVNLKGIEGTHHLVRIGLLRIEVDTPEPENSGLLFFKKLR